MLLLRLNYRILIKKLSLNLRSINSKKSDLKMNKIAYFHLQDNSDYFKVSFLFENVALNVSRQFNFQRQLVETVESFVQRVTTNLEKHIIPKMKRKSKKKEPDVNEDIPKLHVELITENSSVNIQALSCKEVFFSNKYPDGSLKLKMNELEYVIAVNYPWVDSITLPSSIMSGFPAYANTFEAKFIDKAKSDFVWSKSSLLPTPLPEKCSKKYWTIVGNGFIYMPTNNDIGCQLKLECTPKNCNTVGPKVEQISKSIVVAGPGYCPFEERHLYTQKHTIHGRFRVVSYNILADVYSSTDTAQNELFDYCPHYALSIDYRKQLFLKELLGYNADLICLQEVDTKVFESDLGPVLGEQGLTGVHAKKSTISEGVCSFYSTKKFKLLDVQEVVLSQELQNKAYCSHILTHVNENQQLKERITGLGTAAQALILESLEKPGETIILGNTHLYFHPDADHIRLLQAGIVTAFLTNVVESTKKKLNRQAVSLMCCGDFNSVPECGIYKLFTSKSVPKDFKDWSSKPEEEVKGLSLSQPFCMASACGTPDYTNYTVSFAACLDYIYYQTDRLAVDMVVPLPSDDVLREHRAIPSVVFPSDHVALIADLKWAK